MPKDAAGKVNEPSAERDEVSGRFLQGNSLWRARSSAGPKPKFACPEHLWNACVEYFDWAMLNPLQEIKLVTFHGEATLVPVPKMRAMTVVGLCVFLDISRSTWNAWKESRPDLSDIIERVEAVIFTQKFEGAAADLINGNIISRELGLTDRQEHTGMDGGAIETKDVSDVEIARRIAFLLAKGNEMPDAQISVAETIDVTLPSSSA